MKNGDSRKPERKHNLEVFRLVIGKDAPPAIGPAKPPPKIEAAKPPPKIEAAKPPPKIEAAKPPPKIEAAKPPPKIEAAKPPPRIAPVEAPTPLPARKRAAPAPERRSPITWLPLLGAFAVLALVVAALIAVPRLKSLRALASVARPTSARAFDAATAAAANVQTMHLAAPDADDVRRTADIVAERADDVTASGHFPFNGYLYDLPRDKAFADAWQVALAELPVRERLQNRWLSTLEASAVPNHVLRTSDGTRYAVAWGCDPRACARRTLRLVVNRRTGAIAAATQLDGTWYTLGSDAAADRAVLLAVVAREKLGFPTETALDPGSAAAVERFVAAVPD